jgi:hypothetical protein
MSDIEKRFVERTSAELKLALDEIRFWDDLVARGKVGREQAKGYVGAANSIIKTKRFILSFYD